jgi:hypothetical protein
MVNTSQPYDLGYTFYPPLHRQDPGHPRLDISLRSSPTELHFDPEKVELHILSPDGDIETLVVTHPWTGISEYRVYPGRIVIRDRKDKTARAFTFGGKLEIHSEENQTISTIQSNAPILSLTIERSVAVMLAEEVEILLAERRGAWAEDLDGFENRLKSIDPLTLYLASLNTLRKRFDKFPTTIDSPSQKFSHFLLVESQAIQELHHLPSHADTLEELL